MVTRSRYRPGVEPKYSIISSEIEFRPITDPELIRQVEFSVVAQCASISPKVIGNAYGNRSNRYWIALE